MAFSSARGSAILWVLVGVALFAALGFAFMSSSHTSTSMLTNEAARSYAHQIIAYGNDMKSTFRRMILSGVAETGVGFDNTVFKFVNGTMAPDDNPTCTTNSCQIFSPAGGQFNPLYVPEAALFVHEDMVALPTRASGAWRPYYMNMNGVGSSTSDVTVAVESIAKEVCIQINDILGVENPGGNPPILPAPFQIGLYTGGAFPTAHAVWGNLPSLEGKRAYCYTLDNPYKEKFYNYVTVLLEK